MKIIKNQKSKIKNFLLIAAMILTAACKEDYVRVTGVTFDRNEVELEVGGSMTLKATVHPANATEKTVYWRSDDPRFATVTADGLITGIANMYHYGYNYDGYSVIVASTMDGEYYAYCSVTVKYVPVTGMTLNKTSLTLAVGETEALTATVVPANATNKTVNWYSDSHYVAIVNDNGVITAADYGTANITVITEEGYYEAICEVIVAGILPELTTNAVTTFTETTAVFGGSIFNAGTPAYYECGVCYSITQNPTTENNKTVITGTETGSFNTNVSGLTANTTYYVRAYAINSAGTAYGEQVSFTTSGILPVITINTQPEETTNVMAGSIFGSLNVAASVTQSATLSYQWYSATTNSNTGGTPITGATFAGFTIPATLTASGSPYYYFCELSATGGATPVRSNVATVIVSVPPVITINTQPTATTNVTAGSISGSLNVAASVTQSATLSFQWYSNTTNSNMGGTEISGATFVSFTIPANLTAGTYYYFCEVGATGGATSVRSNVATVNVTLTGAWIQKVNFGGGNRSGAFGFSIGNKGYIGTGGSYIGNSTYPIHNDFWEYDPVLNIWSQKADFAAGSANDAVGFSIGNKGYVGVRALIGMSFWEYDPMSNSWTQKADFAGDSRSGAVGFSIGNKGYIGTGNDRVFSSLTVDFKDFWEYDPVSNVWTQKADFAGVSRSSAVGFSIGNKGYVGIGYRVAGSTFFQKDFWEYDPVSDSWTQKADFAGLGRNHAVGFSIGNKGYIGIGERDGYGGVLKDFWEFDPVSNNWTQKVDFAGVGRIKAVGFSIGNKGYIGTGLNGSGSITYRQDFWEFTP